MNDLIFRQVRILDGSGGAEFIGTPRARAASTKLGRLPNH